MRVTASGPSPVDVDEGERALLRAGLLVDGTTVRIDGKRALLRAGLLDWGGPARPTDALAVAMGFSDAARLSRETRALRQEIERTGSLTAQEWQPVMPAVEMVFVSDVVGSGLDWRFTSGISDTPTIETLRGLQRELPRWRGSVRFTLDFTLDNDGRVTNPDPNRPRA